MLCCKYISMELFSLGAVIEGIPELSALTPPFAVDAIIVDDELSLSREDAEILAIYRRYGRPVITSKTAEVIGPRTNYSPINCSFYDNFEAAIVQRRPVALAFLLADDNTVTISTRLIDLKTDRTEEYVQLADKRWIRLDRIVSVDGELAGASCSF